MHGADSLGEHPAGQNPLFPPVHGCLVGIFSADAVLSTSARRQISLHAIAAPPSIPKYHRKVSTHSAKFAICFTASTAPGSGSSSMKKFFDSQMLMAFSYEGKDRGYCTGLSSRGCPEPSKTSGPCPEGNFYVDPRCNVM